MTFNCTPLNNTTQYFTTLRQQSYAIRSRTSIAYKRMPFNQIPNQIFRGDSWFGPRPYQLSPDTILTEFYFKLHFSIISWPHIQLCALERSLGLNCHLKLHMRIIFFNNFKPFKKSVYVILSVLSGILFPFSPNPSSKIWKNSKTKRPLFVHYPLVTVKCYQIADRGIQNILLKSKSLGW